MTRSSDNWDKMPGSFDTLNNKLETLPSSNMWGIPTIPSPDFIPDNLIMYGREVRKGLKSIAGKTVHFFLDDYKFETLWSRPVQTLGTIQRVGRALSPEFSVYMDFPLTLQLFNTYRNRWMGAYWQSRGIEVIPTISWGDSFSFDFCFIGVEKYSTIAISTVGTHRLDNRDLFKLGFHVMIEELQPDSIIIYGENKPVEFDKFVENVYYYPSYWGEKRAEL